MRRYEGITSFFKIVGRDMMPSKVLRCTEAYLDESYDGNLFDLLCSSIGYYGIEFRAHIDNKALGRTNFFKRTSTCNRQCQRCAIVPNWPTSFWAMAGSLARCSRIWGRRR